MSMAPLHKEWKPSGGSFLARRRERARAAARLGVPANPPATYWLTRRIFLRAMGFVYLIAFWSLGKQILGLAGSNGITPATDALRLIRQHYGASAYWRVPTLVWLNSSDLFLQFLCWGGCGLSLLAIGGLFPGPVLLLLWAFYLSLTSAGGVFMHFQWDILLLEAGFLAILWAPWTLRLRSAYARPPSHIVLFLLRWLLFRLMFLSGLLKLTSGDPSWSQLTALQYHYETQPIPTSLSWYMHNMPMWFTQLSTALMFAVELIVPFFVFGPRLLRLTAFAAIAGMMALIAATGNYNFFNLLTVVLCIPLLDDAVWAQLMPRRSLLKPIMSPSWLWVRWVRPTLLLPLAIFLILLSISAAVPSLRLRSAPATGDSAFALTRNWVTNEISSAMEALESVFEPVEPLRLANSYGLFRHMTQARPEIILEGSNDGVTWKEFEFPWKPGDVARAPAYCEPHQPRLDWQMWFAALAPRERSPWIVGLIKRILEGSPEVLALLENNPFPTAAPKYVRAKLYDYHFTDPKARMATGTWWRREYRGMFFPPVSIEMFGK